MEKRSHSGLCFMGGVLTTIVAALSAVFFFLIGACFGIECCLPDEEDDVEE